jgi:hypothetical protein
VVFSGSAGGKGEGPNECTAFVERRTTERAEADCAAPMGGARHGATGRALAIGEGRSALCTSAVDIPKGGVLLALPAPRPAGSCGVLPSNCPQAASGRRRVLKRDLPPVCASKVYSWKQSASALSAVIAQSARRGLVVCFRGTPARYGSTHHMGRCAPAGASDASPRPARAWCY